MSKPNHVFFYAKMKNLNIAGKYLNLKLGSFVKTNLHLFLQKFFRLKHFKMH